MARVRRSGEGNDLQADDRVADLQHEVAVARVEDADFQLSGETGIDVQLIRGDCAEPREMRRRAEPCEMVDRQGQAFARDDARASSCSAKRVNARRFCSPVSSSTSARAR